MVTVPMVTIRPRSRGPPARHDEVSGLKTGVAEAKTASVYCFFNVIYCRPHCRNEKESCRVYQGIQFGNTEGAIQELGSLRLLPLDGLKYSFYSASC